MISDNTHNQNTTNTPLSTDPRTLAEERLAHLAMIQTRMQRRGGPDRGPWREGRGGQGRVLALLAMNPEISQRELTFLLGLSRQALAELLAKLEGKGFVERSQSDADRRVVLVKLTDAGREAAQKIDERMQEPSHMLDALTDEEAANLADYLERIITPLEERIAERREQRRRRHAEGPHGDGHHGGVGEPNTRGRGPVHGGPWRRGYDRTPGEERHYRELGRRGGPRGHRCGGGAPTEHTS